MAVNADHSSSESVQLLLLQYQISFPNLSLPRKYFRISGKNVQILIIAFTNWLSKYHYLSALYKLCINGPFLLKPRSLFFKSIHRRLASFCRCFRYIWTDNTEECSNSKERKQGISKRTASKGSE